MSFAANSIGFLLQVDDSMSATLLAAEKSYNKFVKSLDILNEQAYESASRGIRQIAKLAQRLADLPKQYVKSHQQVMSAFQQDLRPITQSIKFAFSGADASQLTAGIAKAVSKAIASALGNIKIGKHATTTKHTFTPSESLPVQARKIFGLTGPDTILAAVKPGETLLSQQEELQHQLTMMKSLSGEAGGSRSVHFGPVDPLTLSAFGTAIAKITDLLKRMDDKGLEPFADGLIKAKKEFDAWSKSLTVPRLAGMAAPEGAAGEHLQAAMKNWKDVHTEIHSLREAVDAGLISTKQYRMEVATKLNPAMQELDKITKLVGYDVAKKLLPEINEARDATSTLTKESKSLGKTWKDLWEKILGPAKFLALSAALTKVQEGISHVFNASHQMFTSGTAALGDFITQMNQVNKMLGLSRGELAKLKDALGGQVGKTGGAIDFSELGAAFGTLRAAGIEDVKLIQELSSSVAMMSVATNATLGSVSDLFREIHQGTKLSAKDMEDLAAGIAVFSQKSGANVEDVTESMKYSVAAMRNVFRDLDETTQKSMLNTMTRLSAALIGTVGAEGKQLTDLIAQTAAGIIPAQNQLQQLVGRGMNITAESMKSMLQTGKGAPDLLKSIGANVRSFGTGPGALEARNQVLGGFDSVLLDKLAASGDKTAAMFAELQKESIAAGGGFDILKQKALDNMPIWQRWANEIGNFIGNLHILGISGVDVINFLKEFNLTSIAALVYIGKSIGEIPTLTKVFSMLGGKIGSGTKAIWEWGKGLLGFNKVAAKTTTAAVETAVALQATAAAETEAAVASVGLGGGMIALADGIEALIVGVGVGVATVITAIAAAVGTGITAILTGITAGLALFNLPGVLTGGLTLALILGAIGAAMVVFAAAAYLATPFFEALAKLNVEQLLLLGPAMASIGVGFAAMGAGIVLGMATMLVVGGPWVAIKMLVWSVNSIVEGLGGIETGKFASATTAIKLTGDFMREVAQLATTYTTAMANMPISGGLWGLVKVIYQFFVTGFEGTNINAWIGGIKTGVGLVVTGFSGDGWIDQEAAKKALANITYVSEITVPFAALAKSYKDSIGDVPIAGGLGGLVKAIYHFFVTGFEGTNINKYIEDIRDNVQLVVDDFSSPDFTAIVDVDKAKIAKDNMQYVADVLAAFAPVAKSFEGFLSDIPTQGGLWGLVKAIYHFFVTGFEGTNINKYIEDIKNGVDLIVTGFSGDDWSKDKFDGAKQTMAGISALVISMGDMAGHMKTASTDLTAITPAFMVAVQTMVDSANEIAKIQVSQATIDSIHQLTALAHVMTELKTAMPTGDLSLTPLTINHDSTHHLTSDEIQSMVALKITGDVNASDETTHELLRDVKTALLNMGGGNPQANGTAAQPHPLVRGMA